ncbi:MAG: endonuclease/exonuclease/phosphatase family protein [Victivallales bacterium]|nr:endonuclease/exonuclease/phosphatase family protein [Victivallales bacterium]
MKLIVYNIAYGAGAAGTTLGSIGTSYRYLRSTERNLEALADFIRAQEPDIVGLLEVDIGSCRTGALNQVEEIAMRLSHYHLSSVKYSDDSLGRRMPIFRHQANAVLTRERVDGSEFHFFDMGFKRLVIEVRYRGIDLFFVHLSLRRRVRARQLVVLADLIGDRSGVVVAGDFNVLSGSDELSRFRERLGLKSANIAELPTFPSWSPRKELDFILYSDDLVLKGFSVPNAGFSDHLPLIVEIQEFLPE